MSFDSAFRVEYAKSDKSNCIGCRSTIRKNSLRFAVMVQSPRFDGKISRWYHKNCFWKKVKVDDVQTIKGLNSLRWKDQEAIRRQVKPSSSRRAGDEFIVRYAETDLHQCSTCQSVIDKDTLCVSKKEDTTSGSSLSGMDALYHVDCFDGLTESLLGFNDLKEDDQIKLKEKFNGLILANQKRKGDAETIEDADNAKQTKLENSTEPDELQMRKEQNELLWTYRDALYKQVSCDVLRQLLEFNSQKTVSGQHSLLEAVTDCMAFGSLEHCPSCGGYLAFNYTVYQCTGNATEWAKCSYSTQVPSRKPFQIPVEIKQQCTILQEYQYTKRDRVMTKVISRSASTTKRKRLDETHTVQEPKYNSKKPLKDYSIATAGRLPSTTAVLQKEITRLGGKLLSTVDASVDVVISTPEELQKKNSKKIADARTFDIHVVTVAFLDQVQSDRPSIVMEKLKISTWGTLPHLRKPAMQSTPKRLKKSAIEKVATRFKDGTIFDPESGLEDTCHVLKDGDSGTVFATVLGFCNVISDRNSYYKIQLLEADTGNEWFLFRGRIGTRYGGNKTVQYNNQSEAIKDFEDLFLDKTGNNWADRETCKKIPNKFYPLEIDYGNHEIQRVFDSINTNKRSILPQTVKDLLCFIFDVKSMEQALSSFEIDLTKMPLGRLSRNQLNKGYQVLNEIQTLIDNGCADRTAMLDATNRFYTLIPHTFHRTKPILLDHLELIKSKTDMINNLLEIEQAYSMLKETKDDANQHSIDDYYAKLKCALTPVDHESEEFRRIEEYLANTYAPKERLYTLKLKEVFTTVREGESERFQKWKASHNRQLLWHGSRKTNFAGILSQGLRIAPPDAPSTGYNFGKGVYFADMVCKGAHYCFATKEASEGLMLLCEVALGSMQSCYKRTSFAGDTLPTGIQSVKGCGRTIPNPKGQFIRDDGVIIPMGRHMNVKIPHGHLQYNEFIVYDTDQIQIKYLLRVNFEFLK